MSHCQKEQPLIHRIEDNFLKQCISRSVHEHSPVRNHILLRQQDRIWYNFVTDYHMMDDRLSHTQPQFHAICTSISFWSDNIIFVAPTMCCKIKANGWANWVWIVATRLANRSTSYAASRVCGTTHCCTYEVAYNA